VYIIYETDSTTKTLAYLLLATFEVNAIIYDRTFAKSLAHVFESDIKEAVLMNRVEWQKRSVFKKFFEKVARLVSPLL